MDSSNYAYMDTLFLDNYRALDQLPLLEERNPVVEEYRNATILPFEERNGNRLAGVVDEDGAYVQLSSFDALSPVDAWGGAYEPLSSPTTVHQRVMYLGRFWKHWGHFLMDLVSRLWYALEHEPNISIAYDGKEAPSGVYEEFLLLAGIQPQQLIRVDAPTRFDSVVVPECTHVPGRYVLPTFAKIFDVVTHAAIDATGDTSPYNNRAVYLSRLGLQGKNPTELGEKSLERLLEHNGFIAVQPERLTLREQIAAIRCAREVACLSGTLPHTMMFANDGARLTVFRKSNKPVYRQASVDQVRALEVTHVDAHVSPNPVGPAGPFVVTVNNNVRRWAADRGFTVPNSRLKESIALKGRMLRYTPFYVARNRGRNYTVPLFIDGEFSTTPTATKELRRYYLHRL